MQQESKLACIFSSVLFMSPMSLKLSEFLIPNYHVGDDIFVLIVVQKSFKIYTFFAINFVCYFYELACIVQTGQLSRWLHPRIFCCYQLTHVWPIHKLQIIINKTLTKRNVRKIVKWYFLKSFLLKNSRYIGKENNIAQFLICSKTGCVKIKINILFE